MGRRGVGRKAGVFVSAILVTGGIELTDSKAQQPAATEEATPAPRQSIRLPTIRVVAPQRRPTRASRSLPAPAGPAPAPAQPAPLIPTSFSQDSRSGTVGYLATRTSSATRTNTPLIDIPQSVTVLTQEFIRDQAFQSLPEALRYVPGVIPHQGESNRDDLVIRGQRSNADFYVNGIRDDVQYVRDLYNTYSIEVLKGPNAMIFGRGGGGGVVNRILKAADGTTVRDVTAQFGSFNDRRFTIDLGQAISESAAYRINGVYEYSDSYRDYVNLERYGINPTVMFRPDNSTTVWLSYEYFHDRRVTDRGIPSQQRAGVIPGPATPLFPYETSVSAFFGNPNLNYALVDANIFTGVIEHEFDNGLKVRNASRYADYNKFFLAGRSTPPELRSTSAPITTKLTEPISSTRRISPTSSTLAW